MFKRLLLLGWSMPARRLEAGGTGFRLENQKAHREESGRLPGAVIIGVMSSDLLV